MTACLSPCLSQGVVCVGVWKASRRLSCRWGTSAPVWGGCSVGALRHHSDPRLEGFVPLVVSVYLSSAGRGPTKKRVPTTKGVPRSHLTFFKLFLDV